MASPSPSLNGKVPAVVSSSSSLCSISPSSSASDVSSSLHTQRLTRTTIANSNEDPRYNTQLPPSSSSFSPFTTTSSSSSSSSSSPHCSVSSSVVEADGDAEAVESFISSHANDLFSVLEEKRQRSEDIHLLEQNVRMVKEVFDDFEKTVNAQSPQLDMIQNSVIRTEQHVQKAERELISAASYQRTGYVLASTAVGLLVGGPAGAAIGAKCALGAVGGGITIGLGGSLLGFGVGQGLQTMAKASTPTQGPDEIKEKERQSLTAHSSSSSSSSTVSEISLTQLPSATAPTPEEAAVSAPASTTSSSSSLPSSKNEGSASIAASLASYVPFVRLFSSTTKP